MSTTPWAVLLATSVIALFLLLWRKLAGPSPIRLSSQAIVREVLRTTLRNGARGARVRLQTAGTSGIYLDFRKYFAESGVVGLRAVVELTARSEESLDPIIGFLESRGIPYARSRNSRDRESVAVDVASDLILAEAIAYGIFEEVLGLNLTRDVVGTYDLVLITNDPSLTGVSDSR